MEGHFGTRLDAPPCYHQLTKLLCYTYPVVIKRWNLIFTGSAFVQLDLNKFFSFMQVESCSSDFNNHVSP